MRFCAKEIQKNLRFWNSIHLKFAQRKDMKEANIL